MVENNSDFFNACNSQHYVSMPRTITWQEGYKETSRIRLYEDTQNVLSIRRQRMTPNKTVNRDTSENTFSSVFERNEAVFDQENADFDVQTSRFTIFLDNDVNCFTFIDEARERIYPNRCIAFHTAEQLVQQIERDGGTVYPFINLRKRILVRYTFQPGRYHRTISVRYYKTK